MPRVQEAQSQYDIVILGAGLAGLTLARQLMLYTKKRVLLLDRRMDPPTEAGQKYGESLVQLSGYYLSKVLDLQEHLLQNHYLKYNLRFHWPTHAHENVNYEDYSQSYIRRQSNIATFQLDRNLLEAHLLEINTADPRMDFLGGIKGAGVDLNPSGDHRVYWEGGEAHCRWFVDTSGRNKTLQRHLGLGQQNSIRHGSVYFWVEGLVDIERLTELSHTERIHHPRRQKVGHFPAFLGTNHFCAEGQWFWVIPLHGKTSLGLVFDRRSVPLEEVATTQRLIDYVCRKWPLFARDLPNRKIVAEGKLPDYSYDCRQTISADRWAMVGEAGRFSDPLYSPGSDLITIYNTLVVDAIQTDDAEELASKCQLAEQIERVMYESYVPSYAVTYNCLGDQEAFTMKYTWELAVYFCFYVIPAVNGFWANQGFMRQFLRRYGALGAFNQSVQNMLSAFFEWKKENPPEPSSEIRFFDFYDMKPLDEAEKLFYVTGVTPEEAIAAIDSHMVRLEEFARYILAQIYAQVIGDKAVLKNAAFVRSIKLRHAQFDPDKMRAQYAMYAQETEMYSWCLNPMALGQFLPGYMMEKSMMMDKEMSPA